MRQATTGYRASATYGERTAAQWAALTLGVVLLLVGIAGFIPGITQDYDELSFTGHDGASLLGLFEVNVLHNIVHLAFGVAGIAAATTYGASLTYLFGGGVIYLALWVYGMFVDTESDWNFAALNTADNWLHFGLSIALFGLGLLTMRGVPDDTRSGDRVTR